MTERKVFVTFDGDAVGARVGRATLADDVATIRRVSEAIEAGNEVWTTWSNLNGGEVINVGGDEGRLQIPFRLLGEIAEVAKRYRVAVGSTCCVGVGAKLSEAQKALAVAKTAGPGTIKCYTAAVEAELEQMAADKENPEAQKTLQAYFTKSEDAPVDYRIEFKRLADSSDKIQSVQAEAHENETHEKQWRDDLKHRVSEALHEFRNNLPQLAAMKQNAPDAYRSVLALVQSVTAMSHQLFQQEELTGGKADNVPDEQFDPQQLQEGVSHEMEHTDNPDAAKEIAKDHISEDQNYYTKLKAIEPTLDKASLDPGKTGRHHLVLPVGSKIDPGGGRTSNAGKIKIRKPDGKTSWISARSGLIMGPDGNPKSSRSQ